MPLRILVLIWVISLSLASAAMAADDTKKIVFVAGKPSHGYGAHEHNAGCLLLAKYLKQSKPKYETEVFLNGWPESGVEAFDGADAVVVYCDGGKRHLLLPHLEEFKKVMKRGIGLACIHYAVEVPEHTGGGPFLDWIGGYFETHWSVNPHWTAKFTELPDHPICRGVEPFEINDEWYFHMRFQPDMVGVTPILSAHPPASTMSRKDGPHSGNPHVRAAVQKNEIQHVAWALERPDGGRGFGFTGGHVHWNWGDDNFRKLVLNAIAWIAHDEVPAQGIAGPGPTRTELEANQDFPKPPQKSQQLKRTPDEAVAQLEVHPKLTATLFAAEPLMLSPSSIDIDHRGRVWVCEVVNYRKHLGKRPTGDRILILEDTDQDGQADRRTVFYEGSDIDSPHGVCVLGNRVIVSAGPHVLCLTDTDGDDRADEKEVWFQGISGVQHDHGIHAFVFGPDGKLYFNFGNMGKQLFDPSGKLIIDMAGNEVSENLKPYQQGMVFRCNLDRTQFETLGWNFRNNWMLTVDSFGTIWQSDNDDDGNRGVRINYVMEFGNYGFRDERTGANWRTERIGMSEEIPIRHWHLNDPGVVPNLLQTGGGSPTGITIYEGDGLLPELAGQLIHCDAGPSVTRSYVVANDGAGYKAEVVNLLEGARDNWFRPSDVKVAPDGSLIVADWYDPGVGGHNMVDLDRGRLFRLTPKGASTDYRVPDVDFTQVDETLEALKSPNFATRYMAWQALRDFKADAEPGLVELSRDELPHLRARALWLLGKMPQRGMHYVEVATEDADPRIRILSLRLARQVADVDEVEIARRLCKDDNPQVRRECAIALRYQTDPKAAKIWATLAQQHDGQDRWYLEALGIGADRQWDSFLNAYLAQQPSVCDTPAARQIIWRSRSTQTPELLVQILTSPQTPADEIPRYLRAFDFLDGDQREKSLVELAFKSKWSDPDRALQIRTEAISRLDNDEIVSTKERVRKLQSILDELNGSRTFVSLVGRLQFADRYDDLVELATQQADDTEGIAAARLILQLEEGQRFVQALKKSDGDTQSRIIRVLGHTANNRAVPILTAVFESPSAAQDEAVRSLAKIRAGAEMLLARAKDQNISRSLKPTVVASLHQVPWQDIRESSATLFPLAAAKNDKPLPSILDLANLSGDAQRGRQVFAEAGTCIKCHQVLKQGKRVGPDLSEIGKKLSRLAMFESILYPSAGISHDYETYVAELADGNIVSGILLNQTDEEIEIVNAEGVAQRLSRAEVDQLVRQPISLMPADLHKNLSEQDLVNVVEYLMTLK